MRWQLRLEQRRSLPLLRRRQVKQFLQKKVGVEKKAVAVDAAPAAESGVRTPEKLSATRRGSAPD